jgi:hypothetical protein
MLELGRTFHRSLDRLSGSEQAAAKQVVFDYMADPSRPGLSLHRIDRARDKRFWTIRVDRDLRIVVFKEGARSLFCYVGHHDEAYRWAKDRRYEVHPVTGAAQIVEVIEVVREEMRHGPREAKVLPLFAREEDAYLLSVGVPKSYLDSVKAVASDDDLLALCERLPEEAAEALIELRTGERPGPAPVILPSKDAHPLDHPDARRRFWTTTDEAELARALERPWAEWLVFLHPSQRTAVERNFNGPARVSGAAGTGKSVVAMHRSAYLARISQGGRLMLTTYSKTLAARLSEGMDALLGSNSPERARVEVTHLHAYAMAHASRIEKPTIANGPFIDHLLGEAGRGLEQPFDLAFLRAEWDAVVDFWGITSFEAYREVPRTGRGMALSPRTRRRLWDVFEKVQKRLADRGLITLGEVCDQLRERIEANGTRPFRHVVVDEAQDLGPRELKLAVALAAPGPHALFFAGDVGQRIFRWPFSWLAAGVDVRGRAQRLKVNYRTTAEIRRFADRLLPTRITEIDGEAEERGALSVLHGPDPELRAAADIAGEIAALSDWLASALRDGFLPGQIAILARTRRAIEQRAMPALKKIGLSHNWLSPDQDVETDDVNLGTLHAAKGLEFRAVAVVACDDDHLPLRPAFGKEADADVHRAIEERELSVFYVGCTRARDRLLLTWSGTPSRFLATALRTTSVGNRAAE